MAMTGAIRFFRRVVPPLALLTVAGLTPAASGGSTPPARAVKVLVVTTTWAEAQPWIDRFGLKDAVPVPGLSTAHPAVLCNDDGVCLLATGQGKAGAAASVSAVVDSEALDLTKAYFLVTGLAAIDPAQGTVGSVGWARRVVDAGIAWEIDARSLPAGWPTGYLGILAKSPSDKPQSAFGTEVFTLDPGLVAKAVALSSRAVLNDGAAAATYRAHYAAPPATEPPKVVECDTATSDTAWHGELLGQRVHDWVALLTDGQGTYCSAQRTDNATLAAIGRGADAGLADRKRVAVLHGASRFDRQYAGQTAGDSFAADAGGVPLALDNLVLAGAPLVEEIVKNWSTWQTGVPQ